MSVDVGREEQHLDLLASGAMDLFRFDRRVPTRLSALMRAEYDAARERGFLVARSAWRPLVNLWCHRCDRLRLADCVVMVTPKRCNARIDLLPACLRLPRDEVSKIRAEIAGRSWRSPKFGVGQAFATVAAPAGEALEVGRYLIGLAARAEMDSALERTS